MFRRSSFILAISASLSICVFAQTESPVTISTHGKVCINAEAISKVSLCDTLLISQITSFIEEQKTKDSFFRDNGYLRLVLRNQTGETVTQKKFCYSLSRSYYYFYVENEAKTFPLFYTLVAGKWVLIFDEHFVAENLSLKAKRRFAKKINEVLPRSERIKVTDEHGKKMTLRPVGNLVIDSEKIYCL